MNSREFSLEQLEAEISGTRKLHKTPERQMLSENRWLYRGLGDRAECLLLLEQEFRLYAFCISSQWK